MLCLYEHVNYCLECILWGGLNQAYSISCVDPNDLKAVKAADEVTFSQGFVTHYGIHKICYREVAKRKSQIELRFSLRARF